MHTFADSRLKTKDEQQKQQQNTKGNKEKSPSIGTVDVKAVQQHMQ